MGFAAHYIALVCRTSRPPATERPGASNLRCTPAHGPAGLRPHRIRGGSFVRRTDVCGRCSHAAAPTCRSGSQWACPTA